MKEFIHSLLSEAFVKAKEGGELKTSDLPPLAIEVPKDPAPWFKEGITQPPEQYQR